MTAKRAGAAYLFIICIFIAVQLGLAFLIGLVPILGEFIPSSLISQGMLIIPVLLFALLTPAPLFEQFPFRTISIGTILKSVLLVVCIMPAIGLLNSLSMLFTDNLVAQASGSIVQAPMWASILMIGIIGPFCEELAFRGYFLSNFKSTGNVVFAVIWSSLAFGLMHLNFNQAIYAAVFGIFLALAVNATQSLWTSIIMHMVFNTFEVLIMYLLPSDILTSDELMGQVEAAGAAGMSYSVLAGYAVSAAFAIVGIVCAVLLLRSMRRKCEVTRCAENCGSGYEYGSGPVYIQNSHVISIPLAIAFVLAIAFMIIVEFLL